MFRQIYSTVAVPYRTPGEWAGIPNGIGLQSLYNPELVTPPRIYAEELYFPLGLFSKRDATASSPSTITLIGMTNRIYWPGWELMTWRFDGVTGAFLDRAALAGDIYAGSLYLSGLVQGFDFSLWAWTDVGVIKEFDPESYALLQTIDDSHFGRTGVASPLADKSRDIMIMPATSSVAQIIVYALSSGAVVRTINVSGAPLSICAEDDKRLYVLCSNYVLNLVDYSTGEVISAYRCPLPPSASYVMITWDRVFRRILVYAQVANAADGSSQTQIRGFYPVPLATHLTTLIPLVPPRRGRQIPVLLRAVGDTGEPIAGVTCNLTAVGDGLIQRAPGGTDSNGEAIVTLLCVSAGSVDLNASTNINDGL